MAVGTVRGRFVLDAPALRTLRDLEKQGIKTEAQMKKLGAAMDTVADKEDLARLKAYNDELDKMGRKTAKAASESEKAWAVYEKRVNRHLDSIIARIELAHQRLNSFGRERATPTVSGAGLGGGGGGVGGGGGGGGGLFGGGLSPTRILKSRVGLAAAAGIGLPAVQAGVATVGALAGSAGLGIAGAGAVGAAGLGGLAGGGGLTLATIKPMAEAIGQAADAQKDLNLAVRQFGRDSEEARKAARDLRLAYRAAPEGARAFLGERQRLSSSWARRVRPAQAELLAGGTQAMRTIRRGLLPAAGRAATTAARGTTTAGRQFANFAAGPTGEQFLQTSAGMWAENLPIAERSLESVFRTFVNIQRAARPFFRESMEWLRDWTRDWADGTDNIAETRDRIGEMADHLKSWVRLGGASARLLGNLLNAGAPAGQSTVERLTGVMNEWNDWVRRNPGQVRAFFRRSVSAAEDFARALWDIIRAVGRLSDDLLPVLEHFSTLVSGASALGLLTPGAGALAFGAFRGARGARGGGAPAPAGTVVAPGGGGGGSFLPGVAGGAAAAGMFRGAGAGMPRGGAGLGRAGTLTYGAGFRPGAPVSQVGAQARGLGRVASLGGPAAAGLRGAGRAFAPVAAIMAALDFAGTQGSIAQRGQAALSGATLGLIPRPQLGADIQENVRTRVEERIGGLPQGPRQQREAIGKLRSMTESGGDVFIGTEAGSKDIAAGNKALREELRNRIKAFRDYRQQVRSLRLERTSRDIGEAFNIRLQKGPGAAIKGLIRDTIQGFRGLGSQGKRQLAQNSITWAREQARRNPELAGVYERLRRRIIRQFRRMGQDIKIINGQIFTGSKKEWGNIKTAMTSAAEKAAQEVNESFTKIQRKAVGSLRAMGFTPAQARSLVSQMERGGQQGRAATRAADIGQTDRGPVAGSSLSGSEVRARGGRIWGSGKGDNVSLGGGVRGAPGELVVNQHTEADVNRDLWRAGRPSLGQRVSRERRPQYAKPSRQAGRGPGTAHIFHARGGGVPDAMGALPGLDMLAAIMKQKFGLSVASGLRPGAITTSGNPSDHGWGGAIDMSNGITTPQMDAAWKWLGNIGGWGQATGVQAGGPIKQALYKTMVGGNHFNHIHVALTQALASAPGQVQRIFGKGGAYGGTAGPAFRPINLRGPRTRQRGVPGAMSQRAGDMYAEGLQSRINRHLRRRGGGGGGGITGGGGSAANQRAARNALDNYGWGPGEWPSLKELWTRESGWSESARNPSSGAYGIPQSLPASKMGAAAQGTGPAAARAQIAWGLKYIKGRYGSPSAALAFHNSHNWYARGGRIHVGDSLGVGTAPHLHGFKTDVVGGRSSASGVQALRRLVGGGADPSALLFDLGTNDPSAAALRRSIRQAKGLVGGAPMYVPTVHGPAASQKNAMLQRLGGIHVIPWASRSGGLLAGDQIHATGEGYTRRAQMIESAMGGGLRAGGSFITPPGRTAMFMAGDNPYRREQVTVRPVRPKQRPALGGVGRGTVNVTVNMGGVTMAGGGDAERIADQIADRAGRKILRALDGLEEVIGG